MPINNGKFLPITENLYEALSYTMDASKLTESTWLWVDQICIDQGTLQERNHQVQIMRHVYKNAEEVIIWLGNWKPQLDYIEYLLPEALPIRNFYAKYFPGEGDDADMPLVDLYLNNTPQDIAKMQALRLLFERPWFTRAWVVQEAAMAKRDTVLIGSKQTTMLQLYAICCACLYSTRDLRGVNTRSILEATRLRLTEILSWRRQWLTRYVSLYGQNKFHLVNTMNRIGGLYNASDPKDLVYAFVGMCETDAYTIRVDYGLKLEKVFEEMARYLIKSSGKLRLLGHCDRIPGLAIVEEQNRRALSKLPS